MSVLEKFRLDGSLAVVSGGGRGLGAAGAVALAEAGAHVVLVGRTESTLAETAGRINGVIPGAASFRVADVSEESAVVALMDDLTQEFGSIEILVNNAAVVDEGRFIEIVAERWDRVIDINLRGVFLMAREFARRTAPHERSIINIASLAATVGVKYQAAYSASKGAVTSLTRALAIELARDRIRVNAIAPGYFRTDMPGEVLADDVARDALLRRVPQRRVPEPDEIGPTIVYLASSASAFMTGSVIHLDGGYTAQ